MAYKLNSIRDFMGKHLMKFCFFILLLSSSAVWAQDGESRLRPPGSVECSRDHLTSYTGKVIDYQRKVGQTNLRIATDWGTLETVRITHPGSDNPGVWFLIKGKTFMQSDWKHIEMSSGLLREGVRATAWVCDDSRNPVIDWSPPVK
jgi:hypothetical protein